MLICKLQSSGRIPLQVAKLIHNARLDISCKGIPYPSEQQFLIANPKMVGRATVFASNTFTLYKGKSLHYFKFSLEAYPLMDIHCRAYCGDTAKYDYKYVMFYIKYETVYVMFSDSIEELSLNIDLPKMQRLRHEGVHLTCKRTMPMGEILREVYKLRKHLIILSGNKWTNTNEMMGYLKIAYNNYTYTKLDLSIVLNMLVIFKRERSLDLDLVEYYFITRKKNFLSKRIDGTYKLRAKCKSYGINTSASITRSTNLKLIGDRILVGVIFNRNSKICKLHITDMDYVDSSVYTNLLKLYEEM